jgi:hypothetical protein
MHAGEPLVAPIVDPPHTQATPVAADPPSPQPASEKRRPPGRALDQETARPDEPGGSIVRETPF